MQTAFKISTSEASKTIQYLKEIIQETDFLSFKVNEVNISVEQQKKFIESMQDSQNGYLVAMKHEDKIVGIADIRRERKEKLCHNGELSISVKKDCWGLGVADILMKELTDWSEISGVKRLFLYVRQDNDRAISFYKRYGFQQEAVLKKSIFSNGKYYDEIIMTKHIKFDISC